MYPDSYSKLDTLGIAAPDSGLQGSKNSNQSVLLVEIIFMGRDTSTPQSIAQKLRNVSVKTLDDFRADVWYTDDFLQSLGRIGREVRNDKSQNMTVSCLRSASGVREVTTRDAVEDGISWVKGWDRLGRWSRCRESLRYSCPHQDTIFFIHRQFFGRR
jgi:hypothetical protein